MSKVTVNGREYDAAKVEKAIKFQIKAKDYAEKRRELAKECIAFAKAQGKYDELKAKVGLK